MLNILFFLNLIHSMQSPPQMELFLEIPLYTTTYRLNMMISTFFPLEYGEFGGFFSKINPLQGICKSMTRLTSSFCRCNYNKQLLHGLITLDKSHKILINK